MAHALFWAAWLHQHRGEGQAVQVRVEEGMTLATHQGFPRWLGRGTVMQGWLLVEQGQREAGIMQMLEGMAVRQARAAAVRDDAYYAVLLADAYRKAGQGVEGLNVVTDALAKARQTESRTYEAELYRIKGELLLRQVVVDEEQAESCFQKAIDVARSQSAKSWELRAAMSLSRLWQRQGKQAPARQLLGEIYGWFTEGFDTADLKAARVLLDELC
jgi:predicted ATPase